MGENPYKKDEDVQGEAKPAVPVENGKKEKKKGNKVLCAVGAVALAFLLFVAGGLTMWFSLDSGVRTLITVKNKIDKEYYKEITDEEFYGAIFKAVNESLLDDYSRYMTADEYAEEEGDLAGKRIGLGLVFLTKDDNGASQMLITRVCGNSPAEEAGLKAGDYIVGFGKSETEITESVEFDEFSEFLSDYGEKENFYVKVKNGETERTVSVYKSSYVESYVFYRTNASSYGFTGANATTLTEKHDPLTCLDDGTAYIRLTQFGGKAANQFKQAMDLFKREGKTNLLLDLRGNGGGYMDVMQEISEYFCKNAKEDTPVVAVADYGESREKFCATDNVYGDYFGDESRICVLADDTTASASECLIGCMIDYGAISFSDICLSERDGVAKTYGKGIMQTTYYVNIFKRDAIKLTTAEIRWPVSDRSIHGRGVLPEDGALTVAENYAGDAEIAAACAKLFV